MRGSNLGISAGLPGNFPSESLDELDSSADYPVGANSLGGALVAYGAPRLPPLPPMMSVPPPISPGRPLPSLFVGLPSVPSLPPSPIGSPRLPFRSGPRRLYGRRSAPHMPLPMQPMARAGAVEVPLVVRCAAPGPPVVGGPLLSWGGPVLCPLAGEDPAQAAARAQAEKEAKEAAEARIAEYRQEERQIYGDINTWTVLITNVAGTATSVTNLKIDTCLLQTSAIFLEAIVLFILPCVMPRKGWRYFQSLFPKVACCYLALSIVTAVLNFLPLALGDFSRFDVEVPAPATTPVPTFSRSWSSVGTTFCIVVAILPLLVKVILTILDTMATQKKTALDAKKAQEAAVTHALRDDKLVRTEQALGLVRQRLSLARGTLRALNPRPRPLAVAASAAPAAADGQASRPPAPIKPLASLAARSGMASASAAAPAPADLDPDDDDDDDLDPLSTAQSAPTGLTARSR